MVKPLVAIIIVNFKREKETLDCLHSIQSQTYPHHHTILVDNQFSASSKKAFLEANIPMSYLGVKANTGFTGGNNLGILKALRLQADCILLLNNDTILDPNALLELTTMHKKYPNAILGGQIIQYHDRKHLDHLGGMWDSQQHGYRLVGKNAPIDQFKVSIELDYVCGCSLFASKKILYEIGLLDERYFLYWEEADFCQRAKAAGYVSMSCPKALVYHIGSLSTSESKPLPKYYTQRNRWLFLHKNIYADNPRKVLFLFTRELANLIKNFTLKHVQYLIKSLLRKPKTRTIQSIKTQKIKLIGFYDFFKKEFGKSKYF